MPACFQRKRAWLYFDRTVGCYRDYRHTCLPALAGFGQSQIEGARNRLHQQHEATAIGRNALRGNSFDDKLPCNVPLAPQFGGDSTTGVPCWVDGTMAWNGGGENPGGCSTNPFYLGVQGNRGFGVTLVGSIGGYANEAGVYRCPADQYLDPTYRVQRVRSCSMNLQCGTAAGGYGSDGSNYREFLKYSDFGARLTASDCFVFLDENPLSVNDGWFEYILDGSGINDRPAINHGNFSSFSFADGHAELQLWHDKFLNYGSTGQGDDTLWLAQHGTYHQ